MFAVEFETQVKNGTIQIPHMYRAELPMQVKVIILAEKPKRLGKKKKEIPAHDEEAKIIQQQLLKAAEPVFARVWDNEEDEVWNEYL